MRSEKHVDLQTGDFYFGGGSTCIRTILGTCVAITLWHPATRSGGMCHYLLPTRGRSGATDAGAGMYADEVIGQFAAHVRRVRAHPQDCVVKLFGGGRMFPERGCDCGDSSSGLGVWRDCPSVGCMNVRIGRGLIARNGFRLAAQDVGGQGSRKIEFDLSSGDVWVLRGGTLGQPIRHWGQCA